MDFVTQSDREIEPIKFGVADPDLSHHGWLVQQKYPFPIPYWWRLLCLGQGHPAEPVSSHICSWFLVIASLSEVCDVPKAAPCCYFPHNARVIPPSLSGNFLRRRSPLSRLGVWSTWLCTIRFIKFCVFFQNPYH